MTPREPDRYEAKAKELCLTEWRSIAAALRAERANAIEWVAVNLYGGHHAAAIRALASPAAAPAAEPAPLLPRVLAALEQEASAHDDFDSTYEHAAALALRALAAELRAYIAEREGKK